MRIYGLIGFPLSHSLSPEYFLYKFRQQGILDAEYHLFPMQDTAELPTLLQSLPIAGLNVTIPFKESIIPLLDEIDTIAEYVGAVNTLSIHKTLKGFSLKGYNTDVTGFRASLEPLLQASHTKALIFGTGGASKAVAYVLKELGISFKKVSRNPTRTDVLSYADLTVDDIRQSRLIINATPAGTEGNLSSFPCVSIVPLLIAASGTGHLFYDLVYNPDTTPFLKLGKETGAAIKNGLEMLHLQAEVSWKIWNP